MTAVRYVLAAVVCLWLAAGCQQAFAHRAAVYGSQPDFLLVCLAVLGLFAKRRDSTILGFVCGVVQGALAGANMTIYVLSRTLAGFFVGWFHVMEFEPNAAAAFAMAFLVTVFAQLSVMFLAPPATIGGFLLATMGSAMYNGVLAMPFYALLKRILEPKGR